MELNRFVLWIWIKQSVGFNNKKALLLFRSFGTIEAVWTCTDFRSFSFLTEEDQRLLKKKDLKNAWEVYGDCEEHGITILTIDHPDYPELLAEIENPPVLLFYKGNLLANLEKPALTAVGTRRYSGYGEMMAKDLIPPLCACGMTIVSGVADGIEEFVCESVLRAEGNLIAVLPFGILSGKGHLTRHFKNITVRGALISEVFPRMRSHRYAYHERNRILSGLSYGTLVVEAPLKSGALMTAHYALEQNRSVFAVMANARVKSAEGSNRLIVEGCYPVTDYTDIIQVYLPHFGKQIKEIRLSSEKVVSLQEELKADELSRYKRKHLKEMDQAEAAVFSLLNTDGVSADALMEKTGLSPESVLQTLTELEFKGLIVSCPGNKFKIIL